MLYNDKHFDEAYEYFLKSESVNPYYHGNAELRPLFSQRKEEQSIPLAVEEQDALELQEELDAF